MNQQPLFRNTNPQKMSLNIKTVTKGFIKYVSKIDYTVYDPPQYDIWTIQKSYDLHIFAFHCMEESRSATGIVFLVCLSVRDQGS